MDLWAAAEEASRYIRETPRERLGPASRILKDQMDLEEAQDLLKDVREGVYG